MKRSMAILLVLALASPAAAQMPSLSTYAQLGPYYANTPGRMAVGAEDAPVCLRELRTGERVCRTRFEWRRIAGQIARGESWR